MFELHPVLAKDTVEIYQLDLCHVLLMRDKTYPWIILVPKRADLKDLDDLSSQDRILAITEITLVSKVLKRLFKPHKINVAALGNIVEQLHIHVVARYQNDPAWPGPIWGVVPPTDYSDADRQQTLYNLKQALSTALAEHGNLEE